MDKFKKTAGKFLSAGIVGVLMLVLSGCLFSYNGPGESAESYIREAYNNMYDIDTLTYEFEADGSFQMPDEQTVTFEGTFSGEQDISDLTKPKFTMVIDGAGALNGGTQEAVKAELRMDEANIYFVLHEISDFDGELPVEMVEPFLGQWYSMEMPEGSFSTVPFAGPMGSGADEDLKELMAETDFFKNLKYLGMDDGKHHFSGQLDTNALVEFMVKAAEKSGEGISDAEKDDMKEVLEGMRMNLEMWVDPDKQIIVKTAGVLKMDIEEEDERVVMDVNFVSTVTNFNEPVSIAAPAGVKEFDPMMLLFGADYDPAMMEQQMQQMEEFQQQMEDLNQMNQDLMNEMEGFEDLEGMEGMEGFEGMGENAVE